MSPLRKAVKVSAFVFALVLALAGSYSLYRALEPDPGKDNSNRANDLIDQWPSPSVPPVSAPPSVAPEPSYKFEPGQDFAVIRIPRIDITYPVAEGTSLEVLKTAIGHYTGTAGPGQTGNFATAGHVCCRISGQPYKDLHLLSLGDEVDVETPTNIFVYKVVDMPQCVPSTSERPNGHVLVTPDRTDVIRPVPCGSLSDKPTRKLMTLTTCYPGGPNPAPYRLIVWAELVSSVSR